MKEDLCCVCNKEVQKDEKYIVIIGKDTLTKCHFRFHGDCWTHKRASSTTPIAFVMGTGRQS